MKTAIAIFVKTIGSSPVKTRLAKTIGKHKAEEFYRLSVAAVEEVISQTVETSKYKITPYWAVAEEENINRWKQNFNALYTGSGGLGSRLSHVYKTLLREHDNAILIGSDSPKINPEHINLAIDSLSEQNHSYVIGKTEDGGFYLFGGNKNISKKTWQSVGYSKSTTAKELIEKLGQNNFSFLEKLVDVDYEKDLKTLCKNLQNYKFPSQKQLHSWLLKNTN